MGDLVGKRVRVKDGPEFHQHNHAGKRGVVLCTIPVFAEDALEADIGFIVDFDVGGQAWFYAHELEVLDASHSST